MRVTAIIKIKGKKKVQTENRPVFKHSYLAVVMVSLGGDSSLADRTNPNCLYMSFLCMLGANISLGST